MEISATTHFTREHWNRIYASTPDERLSWFESAPQLSLRLIQREGLPPDARILDVGAGTSRLPEMLADAGYRSVTILDVSGEALRRSRERIGEHAACFHWIEADVLSWTAQERFHLWHDRATFHFLVAPGDRARYVRNASASLHTGGILLLITFAPEGPPSCSGLSVHRCDAETIAAIFSPSFTLLDSFTHTHRTPSGEPQLFQVCRLRRAPGD